MSKNGTRPIINRLITVLVWVVALICFGLLAILGVGPRSGRYTTLTVLSGSMRPSVPVGAVLVDTPEPASALRVGQIVTYAIPVEDHRVITHRVVKIVTGGHHPVFQTKGDANNAVDPWETQVSTDSVWTVRAVVPGLGFAVHWLRDRTIHLVGVLVLPAIVAMWWVASIWRDDDEPDTDVASGLVVS